MVIVFLILLLAGFLRFYNLAGSFTFAGDEEYQSALALSLIKDFHIIWIGVNAAHLGFYLGPYWTYFTAFWLFLSKGDPLILGYVSSAVGIFTTGLVMLVGGRLAGLLYATLALIVFFDQKYWNPTPIPLLSLTMLLSLYKAKQNPKWLILFSLIFGLVFHTHLSLFPLIFIAIFWIIWQKIPLTRQVIFLSLAVFILMVFPLIMFDYFHKGSNITTPLRYQEITSDYRNKINPSHHLPALFQFLARFWFVKAPSINSDEIITSCAAISRLGNPQTEGITQRFTPPLFLSILGTIVLLLFLLHPKTWKKENSALLALFLITIITSFLLFPGGAFEYYLLGIFPVLVLLPPLLAEYMTKLKTLIFLAIFLASFLGMVTVVTNKAEFGLGVKNSLVKQAAKELDGPFELKQTGLCHFYEGWRYLFALNGKKPERSDSDEGLGWLYPEEISQKKVKYTVILSETRVPIDFDTKGAKIIKEGGFTAYILTRD